MDAAEIELVFNSNSDIVLSLFSPFAPTKTTLKARTSGVLLVAGVGSFFAYRVASNFLNNRIFWECLEARHFDRIPTADRRLLYSFDIKNDEEEQEKEHEEEEKVEEEEEGKRSHKSIDDSRSVRSFSMSQHSLSRLNRVRKSTKQLRGLLGSLNEKTRTSGIISRQGSRSIKSGTSTYSISASSTKSASLRIIWEGSQPTWDDSDMLPGTSSSTTNPPRVHPAVVSRLGHVASTSSLRNPIGDIGSVGDLGSVFNDVMSVTSMIDENFELPPEDEEEDDDETSDGIWHKCQVDNNKYMYQSFASETGSEKGSPRMVADDLLSPQNPMIRSDHSKRSRSMYDSAIGGEISSEEGSTCPTRLYALMEGDNLSIIAPSCASLEWCDDLDRHPQQQQQHLEWDDESMSMASSSMIREIDSKFAPKTSRDLMVMACEMFQPYSPPFKHIQNIYHKRRLKRVGQTTTESLLSLYIRSVMYHKCSLLRDISWSSLNKRFENAISECDFMRKWPGLSVETMRIELEQLFDLSTNGSASLDISNAHIRAFKVMLVLEAKRAYDERLAGLFCGDWFNVDSPRDVMTNLIDENEKNARLVHPELFWNLVSRISHISIDIVDCRQLSSSPDVLRFATNVTSPTITWLQIGATSPLPLFYIPDDME